MSRISPPWLPPTRLACSLLLCSVATSGCGDDLSKEDIIFKDDPAAAASSMSTVATTTLPSSVQTSTLPSTNPGRTLDTAGGASPSSSSPGPQSSSAQPGGSSSSNSASSGESSSKSGSAGTSSTPDSSGTSGSDSTGASSDSTPSSSDSIPDSSDSTASSSDSTSDSSSSSSSSSAGDSTNTFEPIPRFGLRLNLELGSPAPQLSAPRILIARLGYAPAVEGSTPPIKIEETLYDYPLEASSTGTLQAVLPTPTGESIDPKLRRGPLLMVALYDDLNQDRRWTSADGFVAAHPGVLYYQPASSSTQERWSSWEALHSLSRLASVPPDEILGVTSIKELKESLSMVRFDESRLRPTLRGTYEDMDPRISFVTTMRQDELMDLSSAFKPGARPLDRDVRDKSGQLHWSLSASDLQPLVGTPAPSQLLAIPGLAPSHLWAYPLVGYQRPLGVAIPKSGELLTADSKVISGLCLDRKSGFLAALWLYPEGNTGATATWIDAPIGALHAASSRLGPGWNLGYVTLNDEGKVAHSNQPISPSSEHKVSLPACLPLPGSAAKGEASPENSTQR